MLTNAKLDVCQPVTMKATAITNAQRIQDQYIFQPPTKLGRKRGINNYPTKEMESERHHHATLFLDLWILNSIFVVCKEMNQSNSEAGIKSNKGEAK